MKSKQKTTNTLRIIAGQWRNRKLGFPDAPGLRPTTDRVRETVFNWLQAHIAGSNCLDLFAGSGAMGIEALSRDAQKVDFVEKAPLVKKQLDANLAILQANKGSTFQIDAQQFVSTCKQQYDVIFIDPPYGERLLEEILQLILEHNVLKPDGYLFIEDDNKLSPLIAQTTLTDALILRKEKKAGNVYYGLAQYRLNE